MGVTYLQHRIVTGSFASNKLKIIYSSGKGVSGKCNSYKNEFIMILYGTLSIIYIYMICLLLAGATRTANNIPETKIHRSYDIGSSVLNSWNGFLNTAIVIIFRLLYDKQGNIIFKWLKRHGRPSYYFKKRKDCTLFQHISNQFTIWTSLLNIILVIICNTSLLNPGPNNRLKVMYQNVRGFVPFSGLGKSIMPLNDDKLLEFQSRVFEYKPDMIILTETWLSKEHLDNEILPDTNYKIFRKDRSKRSHPPDAHNNKRFRSKGGGVLIAIKNDLDIECEKVDVSSKAEIMSISLKSGGTNHCITVCYRVGTLGIDNFKEIERHLGNIISRKKFQSQILVGDFNLPGINWHANSSSTELEHDFIELFYNFGFTQMIDQPTHEKGRTLDLLFSNVAGTLEHVNVLGKNEICSSDHFGITFDVRMKFKSKVEKRKIFNYKRANWQNLNNDLKSVRWDQYLSCDPETGWRNFKNILNYFMKKHIPTITLKNKSQPPWFDCDTHHLCLKKERLRAKFKETGRADDYKMFSECRKNFKKLVREKMAANFDDADDPALISKKFWSHVKSMSNSSRIPGTVNYKNRFRNNPKDQTEIFNQFFEEQFSECSEYNVDIDFRNDEINDIEFSMRRIRKILQNINVNKAPGPDGIHGKVLKSCRESIAYPLSKLFRMSYNIGQIPDDWKLANVVPVHKKGSKSCVENYRPISLTSLVMKVFERIIKDELMAKCRHKLNTNQHGFMPQKSCTTQMLIFVDSLSLSINDNIRTDVIYFDFAKAFDSVNHDIILNKLKQQFDIDGTLLKFIKNYLQYRKQCVVIGGAQSEYRTVKSGVPQGSIIGPLLFVLFINDMQDYVSEGTHIALYADDTKIWRRINNWSDHEILQNDIDALFNWAQTNKMKFHPQKCKVLSVAYGGGLDNMWSIFPFHEFTYNLNGIELDFVENEKDLGVIVTSKLNWEDNILALCLKASSRLGLMNRSLHFVKCQKQKRAFYLALVRSIFEHCSVIWKPTTQQMIQKVESIQRRAVKWILGEQDHHYNDYEYLKRLKDLDLMPMNFKFMFTDLVMFHKIFHGHSVVKFPQYLQPVTDSDRSRLRSNVRPPNRLNQSSPSEVTTFSSLRSRQLDKTSFKCVIEGKSKAFKNSFFFRTHTIWNDLTVPLREIAESDAFHAHLKQYMWDKMIDPH